MVRTYKRSTERGSYGSEMLHAALDALKNGMPLKRAAKEHGIPARSLRRHRDEKVSQPGTVKLGNVKSALPDFVESELHDHIQFMEQRLYGLTSKDVRKLAYEIAEKADITNPFNSSSRMAGKDWLSGFFARHPDLRLREPEGTSIARAVGFNRPKVQEFFSAYKDVLNALPSTRPNNIWNMDETGISNVQKPKKIVATRGRRQVGKMTSAERGITVTVICAMNAAGVHLPPMFIFPRKRMVDALLRGAPPQSVGFCSPKGWTDSDLFLRRLEHFVQFTNASTSAPQIVVLDGHHSHKSLRAILFARENGVHLITLPPHSTHKLQPLDKTYFKSLKSAYNTQVDSWMVSNPGKRVSSYEMAGIFSKAFLKTATPEKAVHGFEACGLWPYNENIFCEEDFCAAEVTNEDQPNQERSREVPFSTQQPHENDMPRDNSRPNLPTSRSASISLDPTRQNLPTPSPGISLSLDPTWPNQPMSHDTNLPTDPTSSNQPMSHDTNLPTDPTSSNKQMSQGTSLPMDPTSSNKQMSQGISLPMDPTSSNKPMSHDTILPMDPISSNKRMSHGTSLPLDPTSSTQPVSQETNLPMDPTRPNQPMSQDAYMPIDPTTSNQTMPNHTILPMDPTWPNQPMSQDKNMPMDPTWPNQPMSQDKNMPTDPTWPNQPMSKDNNMPTDPTWPNQPMSKDNNMPTDPTWPNQPMSKDNNMPTDPTWPNQPMSKDNNMPTDPTWPNQPMSKDNNMPTDPTWPNQSMSQDNMLMDPTWPKHPMSQENNMPMDPTWSNQPMSQDNMPMDPTWPKHPMSQENNMPMDPTWSNQPMSQDNMPMDPTWPKHPMSQENNMPMDPTWSNQPMSQDNMPMDPTWPKHPMSQENNMPMDPTWPNQPMSHDTFMPTDPTWPNQPMSQDTFMPTDPTWPNQPMSQDSNMPLNPTFPEQPISQVSNIPLDSSWSNVPASNVYASHNANMPLNPTLSNLHTSHDTKRLIDLSWPDLPASHDIGTPLDSSRPDRPRNDISNVASMPKPHYNNSSLGSEVSMQTFNDMSVVPGNLSLIVTNGDGRCLFRSLVIGMDATLQSVKRDSNGHAMDSQMKSLEEAKSDSLRQKMVEYMKRNILAYNGIGADAINADLPDWLKFNSIEDRITAMADCKTMPGELELIAISNVVRRQIIILDREKRVLANYGDKQDNLPLYVEYVSVGTDVGHYNCLVSSGIRHRSESLKDIKSIIHSLSPPPKMSGTRPRTRKAESATILTSSPYKKLLEAKQSVKRKATERKNTAKGKVTEKRQNKKSLSGKKLKPISRKRNKRNNPKANKRCKGNEKQNSSRSTSSSDENEEWPCIICCEPFSKSAGGEEWVQCQICLKWAHDECTPGYRTFVCPNCESDDD